MKAKRTEEGPETPSYRYGIPTVLGHGTHEVTAAIAACIGNTESVNLQSQTRVGVHGAPLYPGDLTAVRS